MAHSGDWLKGRLRDVVELAYGSALPATLRSGAGCLVFGSSGEVGRHSNPLVHGPGIVVGRKGSVGAVSWSDEDFWPIDTTYYVVAKGAALRWLFWTLLRLPLARLDSSTGVPGLNRNDAYELSLLIPPPSEQQRIAEILDTLDQAIRRTEQVIAKLKQIKQGLLHDLLTRGIDENGELRDPKRHPKQFKNSPLGLVPREWEVVELTRAVDIIDCKHFTPRYVSEGYPLIRPRNIKVDGLDLSEVEYVSEIDFRILTNTHKPKRGDIVFSRNASFGIPCYFDGDYHFAIGQDVVVMSEKAAADTRFTFLALQSHSIENQIRRNSGGSTFGRINLREIRRLILALPHRREQGRIADLLYALKQRQAHEEDTASKLRLLKQGLMEDLLTGRVRVTNLEAAA